MDRNVVGLLFGILLYLKQAGANPEIGEASQLISMSLDMSDPEILEAVKAFVNDDFKVQDPRQIELITLLDKIYVRDVM